MLTTQGWSLHDVYNMLKSKRNLCLHNAHCSGQSFVDIQNFQTLSGSVKGCYSTVKPREGINKTSKRTWNDHVTHDCTEL